MVSTVENMLGIPPEIADKLPHCEEHPTYKSLFICYNKCEEKTLYCRTCSTKKENNKLVHDHGIIYIPDACHEICSKS